MSLVMVRWLVLTQLLENFQKGNDTNINRQKELLKRPSGINGSVLNILEMWPIPCNAYMIYLVRICAYLFCLLCNSHPTSISAYVMWGAKDRIQVRIKILSCTKKKIKIFFAEKPHIVSHFTNPYLLDCIFFSLCQATIINEYHMVPTLTVRATTLHLQLTYNYLSLLEQSFQGRYSMYHDCPCQREDQL